MPLVTMRQILDHAAENNYGVPAFNINDMEQIIAVLQAAKKLTLRLFCKPRPVPVNLPVIR